MEEFVLFSWALICFVVLLTKRYEEFSLLEQWRNLVKFYLRS